jgi:hypothetical protein
VPRRAWIAAIALVCVIAWPGAARADARGVAMRVVEQWRAAGAKATLLPARFLFDDETVLVPIPAVEGPGACTHVAVVAARGLSFHAKLSDTSNDPLLPDTGGRASSLAGVLELRRCDAGRPVRHVVVTSDAGRGAVEIVVARSPGSLPTLASVIPERTGGALPPVPEAGVLPALPPPEKRAELAEARALRDGASIGARESVRAAEDGNGEGEITVGAGCHRLEVFAKDPRADRPGRRYRLDVDAELRDLVEDRLLARDRTEAPDARLEACVGRATRLGIVFVGAPPESSVIVTRASWPLPIRLPALWGPVPRSKMARVFFARHVAVPADEPVFVGQGASGTTPIPVPVEVGGCYLAVTAVTHGHARSFQLRAIVGARESTDERGATEEAALVAFCVHAHEGARIEVQARGAGVQWGLALYRVKSGVWEAGR